MKCAIFKVGQWSVPRPCGESKTCPSDFFHSVGEVLCLNNCAKLKRIFHITTFFVVGVKIITYYQTSKSFSLQFNQKDS